MNFIKTVSDKAYFIYNRFLQNPVLLSLVALYTAFLFNIDLISNTIGFAFAAVLYTLRNRKIMPTKDILIFGASFSLLLTILMEGIVLFGTIKHYYLFPPVPALRVLVLALVSFICSIIVFYVVSLAASGFLLLLSGRLLGKAGKFIDYLFNNPHLFLVVFILFFVSFEIYETKTMQKGKFEVLASSAVSFKNSFEIIPFKGSSAAILKPKDGKIYVEIFDSNTGLLKTKILDIDNKNGLIQAAKLNNKEILILCPKENNIGKKPSNRVFLKGIILNLDDLSFKNAGEYEIESDFGFSAVRIALDKILLAGGDGKSRQLYIFENGKIRAAGFLKNGLAAPDILPVNNKGAIIAGNISKNKIGAEFYSLKSNKIKHTFEKEFSEDIKILKTFLLKDGNLGIIISNAASLNSYGKERLIIVSTKTFKEISDDKFEFTEKIFGETITPLKNGNLLITGGDIEFGNHNMRAYIYDVEKKKFIPVKNKIKTGRRNAASSLLENGKVLIMGGKGLEWRINKLEVFTLQ